MTLSIDLSPREVARLNAAARRTGTSPSSYVAKLLTEHFGPGDSPAGEDGDFGGRSVADVILEIGTVSGGPTDLAENHQKYLRGFGEAKSPRA